MGLHQYKRDGSHNIRGLCLECGVNPQRNKGNQTYGTLCNGCHRRRHGMKVGSGIKLKHKIKKSYCQGCGFSSQYPCQFDVDHIDGNHQNNDLSNLQTLCSNCHRLKTYLNKDWAYSLRDK